MHNSESNEHSTVLFQVRSQKRSMLFFFLVALVLFGVCFNVTEAKAADDENCMLCHQYPLLGRVDEKMEYHSYYVSPTHFSTSVHSQVRCSECHVGTDKIPHEKGRKMDCTVACHILEPTTGRPFSHKQTFEAVESSAHSPNSAYAKNKTAEDFPGCYDCHINEEVQLRLELRKGLEHQFVKQAQGRCMDCHLNRNDFVDRSLLHVVRRTERIKTQPEIVAMCSSCHNDEEFNKRHELVNAVYTYRENYHGKMMLLGLETAPSCLDCHIRVGDSPHAIKGIKDNNSAIHPTNRGVTCTRSDCHPGASLGLGKVDTHVMSTDRVRFPIQFYVMVAFTFLTVVSFVGLMLILIMELFRMNFPNFTIFGRKGGKK